MELESLRMKYEKLLNYYSKQKRKNVLFYLFIIIQETYVSLESQLSEKEKNISKDHEYKNKIHKINRYKITIIDGLLNSDPLDEKVYNNNFIYL